MGTNGRDDAPLGRAKTVSAGSNPGAPPLAQESDPLVGELLDNRYRVIRLIGTGGMGCVYEARHIELDRRFAVKVLHAELSRDADFVERFRREARATSSIGHPNIVEVTDSGRTPEGRAYFVMEFLEGVDLADILEKETRLEVSRAVRIARQICGALEAAHEIGVIHRDLKPENIFLARKNGDAEVVKVVDFGIALLTTETTRLTRQHILGTPDYMAPEQAGGTVDHRSDIYALGAMLYEMLTGKPPHRGANVAEVFALKIRRPTLVRLLRGAVSAELEAVVMDALAYDPASRPQSMRVFAERLDRCLRATATIPPGVVPTATAHAALARTAARTLMTPVRAELVPPVRAPRKRLVAPLGILAGAAAIIALGYLLRSTYSREGERPEPQTTVVRAKQPPAPSATPREPPLRTKRPVKREEASQPNTVKAPSSHEAGTALVVEGKRHLEAGRFDEARAAFNDALAAGTRGEALEGLAQVALQTERFDEAVRYAERAVTAGRRRARLIAANALMRQAKYAQAVTEYEHVLRDFPGNREATRNLTIARSRAGATP